MEGDDKLPVVVRKLVLELAPIAQSRDPKTCWYALAFLLGKTVAASTLNKAQRLHVIDVSYGVAKGAADGRYVPSNSPLAIAREMPQLHSHEMIEDITVAIRHAVDTTEAVMALSTVLGICIGGNYPPDKREGPLDACISLIMEHMGGMIGQEEKGGI